MSLSEPYLTTSMPMRNTVTGTLEWPCSDLCQGPNSSHHCPASSVQTSTQWLQDQPWDWMKLFSIWNVSAPLVFASKHSHKRSLSSWCNTGWTQAKWRVWTHPLICPFVRQKYRSCREGINSAFLFAASSLSSQAPVWYKVAPLWCLLLTLWPASSQQWQLAGSPAFLPEELSVMAHTAQVACLQGTPVALPSFLKMHISLENFHFLSSLTPSPRVILWLVSWLSQPFPASSYFSLTDVSLINPCTFNPI